MDGSFYIKRVLGGNGLKLRRHVMQRSDAESGQKRLETILFSNSRFGGNVSNPGVYFTGSEGMIAIT